MNIDVDERGLILLKEVYVGVLLETSEGNQLGVVMRDDTFELAVPKLGRRYRINMKTGQIYDLHSVSIPITREIDPVMYKAIQIQERYVSKKENKK